MANIPKTPPSPLSHPFYTFFKRIFEQSGLPVSVRLLHLLECTALLLVLVRSGSLAMQLSFDSQFPWDPLGEYFASKPHLYDRYLLACFLCLVLYTFILNCQLFLGKKRINTITWQAMVYDLTVRNLDQAQQCCRLPERSSLDLNQAARKLRPLSLLYHTIQSNLFQAHLNLDKLHHPRHKLTIFAFLSVNSRKKLLQFQFIAYLIVLPLPFIDLLPFLLGLTLHLSLGVYATQQIWSLPGILQLLSDFVLLWITGILLFRNVLLLLFFGTITSLATICHLQAAHRMLRYLQAKYRSSPFQGLNNWNRLLLRNFLTEHAQICTLVDASNGQFISLAVFSAILLHAPTNIYLIYRLVYRPILTTEFTAILVLTVAQILALACAVVPLALANSALYQTGRYLPGVQLSVLRGERCRPLKFKYEILQSTLTESRVKSGATIGPVCLITFESLYKVVTLYAVYMIAFFDLLPK